MRVSVNHSIVSSPAQGGDTLATLLDSLRQRGEIGEDEVVVSLDVDNHAWGAQDMDGLQYARLEDIHEVAIATTDLRGYARRILTDAASMLNTLEDATHRVADGLREASPEKANAHLFDLFNALQQFLACLYHVQNACDLAHGLLGSSQELLSQMTDSLDAIQSSQEEMDWGGLADSLDERLLPVLTGFSGVIDSMKEEL